MKNKRKLLGLTATASLLSLSAVLASCEKVKEYTVTFKNGSETVAEQPVQAGFNAKVPTAPTSGDLEFNGWYKDEAKTTPFDFGSVITEDTTVYANWVNKYTVTFSTDGGSNVNAATVREGGNVAVPTAPTKPGRVFNGWYADAALTTPFNFGSVITKNTTVYARWEIASYNVNLYLPNGELFKTVGVKDGETLIVGANPQINYKTFAGWYTDPSCSEDSVFDVEADLISEDTDLYAKFDAKTEEVTYKFDYLTMIDKYGEGVKSTQVEKFGGFYINTGAYGEYKNNYYTGDSNQPDVNNQQQPIWFTSQSAGQLTFDWRYRSGSSCQVLVYEVDAITDNTTAPQVSSLNENDSVYNVTSGNGEHAEVNIKAGKSYIIASVGSVQIHELAYTNTVGASKPADIDVSGALNSFLCGDTFVSTGLSITMTYENGRTENIAAKDVTVDTSAVDMSKEGTYTVTVKYNATDEYGTYPLSDTYEVNVYAVDTIQAFTYGLNNSRETVYNKLVYAVNDTLTVDGIYVHAIGTIGEGAAAVTFDDQLASAEWELDGTVDMTTAGRKTVTLKYKQNPNVKTTFEIEVVDKLFNKKATYAQVVVDASVEAATKIGDSSYTFKSITEALQYFTLCEVPTTAQKVIVLKNGTYNEKVYIDMPNVTIVGEAYLDSMPSQSQVGAGQTCPVITFDKMNGLKAPNGTQYSTDGAATFTISKKATNCTVCGVKIMNYYNTNALYQESLKITKDTQATACLVRGDMATFAWVTLSGYHDTLYADNGRQMYYNCDIEGRTDFIFGSDATAYFQDCTIRTIGAGLTEKNGGYVVATKGKADMNYGYIFNQCNFVADEATQAGCVSIARGWDTNMKIMVMNCNLGAHFSKGTYGQNYYEKTVTADTFAGLVSTGLFTFANDKYTKLSSSDTFSADETYYVQLNDRYTKMNAAPTATLLFEYNNEGNGAIQYTAELAAKYAEKTFTLLNPADTQVQAEMAKYEDMNTVFKADNGSVKYAENWNPEALINRTVLATITVNGMTNENSSSAYYKLSLTNLYVGNNLVDSQISSIKTAIKKALDDGYSLVGLYTDAEFKTELTTQTVLTANTQVYARIIEGDLEVVEVANYAQKVDAEATNGWTSSAALSNNEYMSATAGSSVASATADGLAQCSDLVKDQYLKSPILPEADDVKELSVVIYGGTQTSGESFKFNLKAYDKAGNLLTTKEVYSSANKKTGYFSATADKTAKGGNNVLTPEVITLKSDSAAISYYTVTFTDLKSSGGTTAQDKKFAIYSIATTYEKIVKAQATVTNYEIKNLDSATELGTYEGFEFINTKDPKKIVLQADKNLTYDGTSYKNCIYTGGGCDSKNAIKFVVPAGSKGKLTAVITSGGDSARWAAVSNSINKSSMDEKYGYVNFTEKVEDTWYYGKTLETTELTEGTYYLNYSNGVRIYYANLEIATKPSKVTTSTENAQLNFNGTATPVYNNEVFDISGLNAQGLAEGYNSDKDYASNKVVGDIKVNVKKGALVYVSAYYSQAEAQVNYTITANGSTSDVLHVNSYVVAEVDQTITITGSGNNYFQDVFVIYPAAESVTVPHIADSSNEMLEAKAYQYSVYNIGGIIIDAVKGKFAPRAQQWAQFNTGSLMLVYLQKGQTFTYTDYEGDDTITAYVLGVDDEISVTNAGAKQETSYTAGANYTLVVVSSPSDGYIGDFKIVD